MNYKFALSTALIALRHTQLRLGLVLLLCSHFQHNRLVSVNNYNLAR